MATQTQTRTDTVILEPPRRERMREPEDPGQIGSVITGVIATAHQGDTRAQEGNPTQGTGVTVWVSGG
jgi:hypothetical protein